MWIITWSFTSPAQNLLVQLELEANRYISLLFLLIYFKLNVVCSNPKQEMNEEGGEILNATVAHIVC